MNILIADKSFEVRAQLKEIISSIYEDPKIQETESNLEAILMLFSSCPGLIITDIDLKDGSGLGLLSLTTSITPDALVIVFTNLFLSNLRREIMNIGADYYIPKSKGIIKIKEILTQNEDKIFPKNRIIFS
jgi:DNA-binding NarL/FixJ family response regulator